MKDLLNHPALAERMKEIQTMSEQKITIDGVEYALSSLSAEAKGQLQMLQVTEQEIKRLQTQLAIAQTARNAYTKALLASLPSPLEQAQASDTLKLG